MALRTCSRCGKPFAADLSVCPYCARRTARARRRVRLLIVGTFVVVLLAGMVTLLLVVRAHGPIHLQPTTVPADG